MSRTAALVGGLLSALLGGCQADLLPGEWVVPGELNAVEVLGPAGLGEALAAGESGALISAGQEVWLVDWSGVQLMSWDAGGEVAALWWAEDGSAMAGVRGRGVVRLDDGALLAERPSARVFVGHGAGWAFADDAGVETSTGERIALSGARALALGDARLLALTCASEGAGCEAFDLSAAPDEPSRALGEAGEGGAVGLDADGVAWWSNPMLGVEDATGVVYAEDGRVVVGEPGDQLGRSLSPRFVAGVTNPIAAPRRARAVPLHDSTAPVIALVGGSPDRPVRVVSEGDHLLVGCPERPGPEGIDGAVYLLRLDLPPFGP